MPQVPLFAQQRISQPGPVVNCSNWAGVESDISDVEDFEDCEEEE